MTQQSSLFDLDTEAPDGGSYNTAPVEEWRRLETEARTAIAAQFGLSEQMTRRIL